MLYESDTNKVLPGSYWYLNVGTTEESKTMGNSRVRTGHLRGKEKSIVLGTYGVQYWDTKLTFGKMVLTTLIFCRTSKVIYNICDMLPKLWWFEKIPQSSDRGY